MRKFSRIFAALLTVCLLIGAVMILALAKAPAGIEDFNRSDDYEGEVAGSDYTKGFGSGSNSAGTYSSLKVIYDEKTDNNYIRFAFAKEATSRYRRDYQYAPYGTPPSALLSDYSYFTVDFDVCADQYLYELDGATMMGTEIPEGAENVRLSYSENTNFSMDNRIFDEANNAFFGGGYTVLNVKFSYDKQVGAWRLYVASNATDYYLSNVLGQWNHFTYAVKVIEKDGVYGYSQVRLYFNGDLLGTSNISTANLSSSQKINPRAIDWYIGASNSDKFSFTTGYSMGIDNFTPSFYPLGYSSGAAYGIDDLYDDPDQSKSIAWCDDVVYSMDYATPGAPYISIDTGSTKYYSPIAKDIVLQKVKNGTIIETGMDILDYTPPAGVDSFEVYLKDDAKFSLSKEAQQMYVQEVSALGYRISKISTDDAIVINWYDSLDGNLVKSELLTANTVPVYGADKLAVIDFEKGAIIESDVVSWMFDIDGKGNVDLGLDNPAEEIRALTPAEINIVKQYCDGVLKIYPSETIPGAEKDLAYAIEYSDDEGNVFAMVDADGGYSNFADISTLAKNVNEAPDGAIVHIYQSGTVSSGNVIVGEGSELSVDLGGNSLVLNDGFVLSNDSVLNVYSSLEGAKLSFADGAVAFSTVGGSSNFNNCDVTLGAYGDCSGDNLSVSAESLFEIATSSTSANDDKNINVSIEAASISGSFVFAASDINLSINNTDISGGVIFSTDESYDVFGAIEANVIITDSDISASEALVGEWCDGAVLTLSSSLVNAHISIDEDAEGDVIFGADNKFVYDVRESADFISVCDGVEFAVSYIIDESGVAIVLATFALDSNDGAYTLVTWNDALGEEFASEYYHESVSVANSPLAAEMTDTDRFPIVVDLDNGWYDIGYTDWKNTADGNIDDAIVKGVENVFVPVADGPVASVDFMVNASLRTTEVGLNLYVKIPDVNSNVLIDTAAALYYVDDKGNKIETTLATDFAGAEGYYAYELPLAVDSFIPRTVFIQFAVVGFDGNGDGSVEISDADLIYFYRSVDIDFMVYAETAAELYACGSDDSRLIFDLVQYKYNAYLASAGENTDDKTVKRVGDFLLSHGDGCSCRTDLSELEFTDAELDASLNGIVNAEVDLEGGKPAIYFYVDSAINVQSFDIMHKGLPHQAGTWDYINYKMNVSPVYVDTVEIDGISYAKYEYTDILLCNAASIMNITLKVETLGEDGTPVNETLTGSWSLASYIENTDDSDFAKALYAASVSALEYRFVRAGE